MFLVRKLLVYENIGGNSLEKSLILIYWMGNSISFFPNFLYIRVIQPYLQFSHSVVSDSLWPHELQHARPPCLSPTPGVYPNSCPLSQWCHLILCRPLLLLPSIFPNIRVFSNDSALCIRWPKYWSFSFNISPSNEHPGLISLGWTGWISLQSKGLSRVFSNTTVQNHQFFCSQPSLIVQLSHPYTITGKTIALTRRNFVDKVMSLLFNMLSRLVITFLPRSKHLLTFNFMAAITICSDFGAQKNSQPLFLSFLNVEL